MGYCTLYSENLVSNYTSSLDHPSLDPNDYLLAYYASFLMFILINDAFYGRDGLIQKTEN